MNTAIIILIFTVVSIGMIYFLLNICIQFNRINSINLQLGMDVTKLYSIEENTDEDHYINYLIKKYAMSLYIFSKKYKF